MSRSIAVVIPAYNAAAFIHRALESVERQSRAPDEIIVVDDGSSDGTAGAVHGWAASSAREVILVRQENRGLPAARNRGIRASDSELIALLDADDELVPDHLATLDGAFRVDPSIVLAFGNARRMDAGGTKLADYFDGKPIERLHAEACGEGFHRVTGGMYASLLNGSFIPNCSTLFAREAARSIGLYDEELKTCEDRDFWLRLSRVGSFAFTERTLSSVHYHSHNLSRDRPGHLGNVVRVLAKMLQTAAELELTREELRATERALSSAAHDLLYVASRDGAETFGSACRLLVAHGLVAPLLHPRHLLRLATRKVRSAIRRPAGAR